MNEPDGYIAVPLNALRELVAASATFRDVVGSSDVTAAKEHVYLQLSDDELEEGRDVGDPRLKYPRPRALVATMRDFSSMRHGPGEWRPEMSWLLSFEFPVPTEFRNSRNDQCIWFTTQVGKILQEMEAAADADTQGIYLPMVAIRVETDPMPCDADEHIEEFWGAEYRIHSN